MPKHRIALISCAAKKRTTPTAACDLYVSDLFRKSWRYGRSVAREALVLSALHGVVEGSTVLAPYNVTLVEMKPAAVDEWGRRVAAQLIERVRGAGLKLRDVEFLVFGGQRYAAFAKHLPPDAQVTMVLGSLGIGERLAALKQALDGRRSLVAD